MTDLSHLATKIAEQRYPEPIDLKIINQRDAYAACINEVVGPMYECLKGIMRIENIWQYPDSVSEEHCGEAEAMANMKSSIIQAISSFEGGVKV